MRHVTSSRSSSRPSTRQWSLTTPNSWLVCYPLTSLESLHTSLSQNFTFFRIIPRASASAATVSASPTEKALKRALKRPVTLLRREHGELAPAFDWAFQCPLHIDVHIDEDEDDEIPDLMSQDEYDSMKTNTIRGFKPRNLSKL
ncbi:hypothetical protein B0H11DRAFT_2264991 [Mycena galericulata]|nr:hypothetical protein B0H11DRAFT_2264991 [Mycena galericulata]